jgi:hypothetical protein
MKIINKFSILHFVLYNHGHAGMCNILMSVQNALIIAKLTNREQIIFYSDAHVFNSSKKLGIFDFYDVKYKFSVKPLSEYPENIASLPDFSNCCFYKQVRPNPSFLNGRQAVDLDSLAALENIGAYELTLGYYSYLFFLKSALKDELVDFVKEAITPKQKYLSDALKIKQKYDSYQSIHIRRGDYLSVPGTRNAVVTWEEMLANISPLLDKDVPVLIHTDEADEAYFQPMAEAGYTLCFFEKELLSDLDDAEKGLISLLVAAHADCFMGTMISTFTGIIQQYRRQHGDYSPFKYLYSQMDSLKLRAGEIASLSFGVYTWNRLELPDGFKKILFFTMEYPECYPDKDFKLDYALNIYPEFLITKEAEYLAGVFESEKVTDNDSRQNRNRTVLHLDQNEALREIVMRVIKTTGIKDHSFENEVQFFDQQEGGETFLHSDSLTGHTGAKRGLSVLFYLNDDYEGGHLDFPFINMRISPSMGMMMCFPIANKYGEQVADFSHSASVITKGNKRMCYLTLIADSVPVQHERTSAGTVPVTDNISAITGYPRRIVT